MGNCLVINLNVPLEKLLECFSQQGAPRGKTILHLRNDWSRLKAERDETLRKIEESPGMRPLEQVNQWLQRVATLEAKMDTLLNEYARQESANICFCGYCPRNCKKSFSSWKKIGLLDQEVLDLQSQVPDVVVERPRVAPALQVPTEPTTGMQSMLDEVWSHVENQQDHYVSLIGLYGMGGVGKTTLLKAVNNKLCSSTQNFDLQFWIVVSKTPNLIDIQNHIGEKIGFQGGDWERKSQEEKAMSIFEALQNKKFILLLDDLWERFDLTKIGIPLPTFQNKSKIIFTTRSLLVCGQMKATEIRVQCLNEDEAWNLFKENVGEKTLKAHRDIPDLARVVMRECNGLPLALIVIGRAMTLRMTVYDWKHAINVLQGYPTEFSTITEEVFIRLKYSYDNLKNDAIRSCLLYCSLYAEDQEIRTSDLVDKWICEGFVGRFHDLDKDRNEAYSYISTLVDASLLEKCSHEEKVKMHDVIRDMALWIAEDGFYVKARAHLTEVPKDVKWGHVEKLSLMDNYIEELNNGPTEVTNLKTILVCRAGFNSINNNFWKFVPNLKVLDLSSNKQLTSLPEEFCELVSLQYLNLSSTNLKGLPNEFRKLVKLIYLNVEFTKVYTIPEGILSSMKELSVFRCGGNDRITYDFLSENLLKEFGGLKCLRDVRIPATSKDEISNLASSINLLNCITKLTLTSFRDSTSLDILFLKELKHLQNLSIVDLKNVEKIMVGEGQRLETSTTRNQNGFNSLRRLEITFCSRLKNLSWLVFFPSIEHLQVHDCDEMETLVSENEFKVDNEVESFAKLQTMSLRGLNKLESIYFTSLSFPCLNRLSVSYNCNNLKRLPFNSSSCDQGRGITIQCQKDWWNKLQWEDEATQTNFSSCFQSLDGWDYFFGTDEV